MESHIYINLATKSARGAVTGISLPQASCKLQAAWQIAVSFFQPGSEPTALDGAALRFALKSTPLTAALLYTSNLPLIGSTYTADFASVDSAALRALIGDQSSIVVVGEIEWTLNAKRQRVHFPVNITNAWLRPDDAAPDPTAEASVEWFNEQLASKATPGGYVEFQLPDGTWVNFALNTGRAPN